MFITNFIYFNPNNHIIYKFNRKLVTCSKSNLWCFFGFFHGLVSHYAKSATAIIIYRMIQNWTAIYGELILELNIRRGKKYISVCPFAENFESTCRNNIKGKTPSYGITEIELEWVKDLNPLRHYGSRWFIRRWYSVDDVLWLRANCFACNESFCRVQVGKSIS